MFWAKRMAEETYDPLYLRGIREFNRRNYFESHEVWEELWIGEAGPDREFYKGLIQAAVALYHFENGNAVGAHKLLHGARALLHPFRPKHAGLDVDRFVDELTGCLECVRREPLPADPPPLDPAAAPRIVLDPAPPPAAGISYA